MSRYPHILKSMGVAALSALTCTACSDAGRIEVKAQGQPSPTPAMQVAQPMVVSDPEPDLRELKRTFDAAETPEARGAAAAAIARYLSDLKNARASAALDLLSRADFERLARALQETNRSPHVLTLVHFHERTGSSFTFAQSLIDPVLEGDAAALAEAHRRFGTTTLFELLSRVTPVQVRRLKPQSAQSLLEGVAALYAPAEIHDEPFTRWDLAFQQLARLRIFQEKLSCLVPLGAQLAWHEKLHRTFEADFATSPEAAGYFLRELSGYSTDAAWLKLRVLGKDAAIAAGVDAESLAPVSLLDRVIVSRLSAHLSADAGDRRSKLTVYCALLREGGVNGVEISVDELRSDPSKILTRGCHRVSEPGGAQPSSAQPSSAQPADVRISRDRWEMPFDSVLAAPGVNLSFEVGSFDGSFVDLSSDRKLARQTRTDGPDPSRDAIAFPIVIGFKVVGRDGFDDGIHFVMGHYPYREAVAGTPPVGFAPPIAGAPGGNLEIVVRSGVRSFAPTFMSQGAPGQQGAPGISGGRGSESVFTPRAIDKYLERFALAHPELFPSGQQAIPVRSPTVSYLKALFEASEHEDNLPRLYVPGGYLKNLETLQGDRLNEQGQRVLAVCQAAGYPELADCYREHLARRFAEMLINETLIRQKAGQGLDVPPFLNLKQYAQPDRFTLPGGDVGPGGEDAPRGASGMMSWEGVQS